MLLEVGKVAAKGDCHAVIDLSKLGPKRIASQCCILPRQALRRKRLGARAYPNHQLSSAQSLTLASSQKGIRETRKSSAGPKFACSEETKAQNQPSSKDQISALRLPSSYAFRLCGLLAIIKEEDWVR
jgi:hypothetical protein